MILFKTKDGKYKEFRTADEVGESRWNCGMKERGDFVATETYPPGSVWDRRKAKEEEFIPEEQLLSRWLDSLNFAHTGVFIVSDKKGGYADTYLFPYVKPTITTEKRTYHLALSEWGYNPNSGRNIRALMITKE